MRIITLLSLMLCAFTGLLAQLSEFSPDKWDHIEKRWLDSQPVVIVYTRSQHILSGQLIHASSDSVFIYPGTGLPVGPEWPSDLVSIHVKDINHVLLQTGGNKVWRKKRSKSLVFPSSNPAFSEPHIILHAGSVYEDSLYKPDVLEEAFAFSHVLRQAYPKKRFRYSIGANFGGDVVMDEIRKAMDESGLPGPDYDWSNNNTLEFLDFSVRLTNRLFLGASLLSRNTNSHVSGYAYNEVWDIGYDYHLDYREHRIYTEYTLLSPDRYFYRKFEVIAGAGLLLARPEWGMGYNYWDVQNPDYDADPYQYFSHSANLLGLQLKTAFHYYLFPGLSIWSALDVNLNQPFVVPEQELPTTPDLDPILLPEHELGFSSVRFKLGLSLYL
jgi:hypothetical protein